MVLTEPCPAHASWAMCPKSERSTSPRTSTSRPRWVSKKSVAPPPRRERPESICMSEKVTRSDSSATRVRAWPCA
ncbi:hypothetical protein ACN28S_44315 [Cystobacter fuscus]